MKVNPNLAKNLNKVGKWLNRNSNTIFMVGSVVTSIAACIEIYKDAPKAKEALEILHENQEEDLSTPKRIWEDAKVAVPIMAPGIILEAVSIAGSIGSYKVSTKRIASLATAYKLSEMSLKEYQSKVIEKFGEEKHKEVKKEIAEDKVKAANTDIVIGDGDYPCIDLFASNMGMPAFTTSEYKIKKAEMAINKKLREEMWISLNELYSELGLGRTGYGDMLGWNIDKVGYHGIELSVGSTLDNNGRPCLTIDYDCDLIGNYEY